MNQEIAVKWAAELRSGKYPQGTSALCRNGEYCCLGVLSEISPIEPVDGTDEMGNAVKAWPTDVKLDDGTVRTVFEDTFLPQAVGWWAGFVNNDGVASLMAAAGGSLACMNDDGASFDTIADLIEEHWECL